jgi:hypothetical protein
LARAFDPRNLCTVIKFFQTAAMLLSIASFASAQLALDANFDHGSLQSWNGNLTNINLVGRMNYFTSGWRWMYFKATGVLGAMPTFTITQNFAGDSTPGPHELRDHEFVYSYDNQNWNFFDNNALLATNTDKFQFSNATPFSQNTVYVAYAIPYPYAKSVAHAQTVIASPWAAPTVSANAAAVIGQTRAGTDDLGRSIPALNLYAYRISDPATDSPTVAKKKVGLSTALHAGETLGTYTFEGLIDWLISPDPRARELRKVAEFFVYPVLNPSGRFAGMNRSTVSNPTRDPNGLWNETLWNQNSYQDIRVTGQAMMADVASTPGSGLDAFIDFHSTVPDYANPTGLPHDFGFVDSDDSNADWWLEVQRLMHGNLIEYTTTGSGDFTSTGFARRKLGAKVEITLETQFTWERNIDYYHNLGQQFGIAFFNSWVNRVPGDADLDGKVDVADLGILASNWQQPGDLLHGDFDNSGIVDVNDLGILATQWQTGVGSRPSLSEALAAIGLPGVSVPEPGCAAMLVIAWLGARRRCR